MKKLLSLVLICAMGLGMVSCVESEESPSVEAIRNAKAEQLKALSNLYNAQAEAEKIVANAEAALLNAKAEYKKEMTKEAAEKFAVELEQIKAEAEAAIKEAEYNAAQWEEKILAMAGEKIAALYKEYSGYKSVLNTLNSELLRTKVSLASTEAGLASAIENAENIIAEETANIAQREAELAILKASETSALVNTDSLKIEKQKALVAWVEAREALKANEEVAKNEAEATAKEVTGNFWYAMNQIPSSAMIVDYNYQDTWDYKYVYDNGDWTSNRMHAINSVKVSEVGLAALTAPASNYEDLVEDVEDAEEALEAAEAAVVDANAFATAASPVLAANQTALVALAKAWDAYNGVGGSAATDVTAAKTAMEAAQADFKADSTNLSNEEKYMAALEALVPQVEEHANDMKAAAEAVKAAKKAWDEAIVATGKAQANVDTISAKCDAVVAQTLRTALENAKLDEAIAEKAYNAAVSSEDLAKAKYEKFIDETNASKALGSRISFDKTKTTENVTAIKNEVKKVDVNIYNYEIALLASTEAYEDAKAEYDELAAGVVTGGTATAAAALVAADSTAKVTIAAVEKLMEDNEDLIEDLGIDFTTATQVEYKENNVPYTKNLYQLIDENKDGDFDFTTNNGVFTTTYAKKVLSTPSLVTDLENLVEDLEAAVLAAKDDLTRKQNALAKGEEGVDNDAYRASVKAAVEALNAQISGVVEAQAAYDAAKEAYNTANIAVGKLQGAYNAYSTSQNWNEVIDQIDSLESLIELAQSNIDDQKKILEGFENSNTVEYKEAQIEWYKEQIAIIEAQIEFNTKMMEQAKAELDAAVAAQQAE